MKKSVYMLFFVIVFGFLIAGCSNEGSKETTENDQQSETSDNDDSSNDNAANEEGDLAPEIRVAINAQPTSLDPHVTTASMTSAVSRNIFEALMALNENYEPVPMLAESVEVSDDLLTYTFKLREGVKFHNGKEMTSEDVVASMMRWLDKSAIAKSSLGEGAVFSAEGDYVVVLQLEEVSSGTLNVIATPKQLAAIYPKEVIESVDDSGNVTEFIGTGPYQFEEWRQDQYIHFSKFDDYVSVSDPADGMSGSKNPHVENLYFDIVSDASTRQAGITTEMYDIAMNISPEHYSQVQEDANLNVDTDERTYAILNFNKKQGPLTDEKIRQAIAAALDLDSIMYGAFGDEDLYSIYSGFMKQDQQMYSTVGEEYYNQKNEERARELLEEAGYNNEEIVLMASRDYDYYYQAATIILEQLQNIGLNVKMEIYDWPTFLDLENDPDSWHMEVTGYTTWITPAENIIFNEGSPGWTKDPSLDTIISNIKGAVSDDELQQYYDELHEFLLIDYVPGIKLGNFKDIYAINNKVSNFHTFEGMILWNIGIED